MKKYILIILSFLTITGYAQTQLNADQVKKDTVTIRGNAKNQLAADTTHFLVTKHYLDSILALTPGNFWKLIGNSATNSGSNFLGTIDNASLVLRAHNIRIAYFDSGGTSASFLQGAGVGANVLNTFYVGANAGANAINATGSNFIGASAGLHAVNARESNFMGFQAGQEDTAAEFSNFIGTTAGLGATNANNGNFIGHNAGVGARNSANANFIGNAAGRNDSNATNSNFIGLEAGESATYADHSNFIGYLAGQSAWSANHANFFGYQAGANDSFGNNSNFFGQNAGLNAFHADNSNFIGQNAGYTANFASGSNFFGHNAGMNDSIATNCNFIGVNTGAGGTGVAITNANAIGANALIKVSNATSIGDSTNTHVGIGTAWPRYTLDVHGQVKIADGTQSNGFVLTSDATGAASWQPGAVFIKNNYTAVVDPTANDDNLSGYSNGSEWENTVSELVWKCVNPGTAAAHWRLITIGN